MLEIKLNAVFDKCDSMLSIKDTTDFSYNKATGFISEDVTNRNSGEFKMSEGSFINLIYTTTSKNGIILHNEPTPLWIESEEVDGDEYDNNFYTSEFKIPMDGLLTIKRLFVLHKSAFEEFYSENEDYIYYDHLAELFYYKVGTNLGSVSNICQLIEPLDLDGFSHGVFSKTVELFTTSHLQNCYVKLLQARMDDWLGDSPMGKKCLTNDCKDYSNSTLDVNASIEIIRNGLTAIDSLRKCGNFEEASRILEAILSCSSVCSQFTKKRSYDAGGCNCK